MVLWLRFIMDQKFQWSHEGSNYNLTITLSLKNSVMFCNLSQVGNYIYTRYFFIRPFYDGTTQYLRTNWKIETTRTWLKQLMESSRTNIFIRIFLEPSSPALKTSKQKQPPMVFLKIGVCKNLIIFTGKHLPWIPFLLKLQACLNPIKHLRWSF